MKKFFVSKVKNLLQPATVKHYAFALALLLAVSTASTASAAITLPDAAAAIAEYSSVAGWVAGILASIFGVKMALRLLRS